MRLQLNSSAHSGLQEAIDLAERNSGTPHFAHSLEWLLFTVLDMASAALSAMRKNRPMSPRKGKSPENINNMNMKSESLGSRMSDRLSPAPVVSVHR